MVTDRQPVAWFLVRLVLGLLRIAARLGLFRGLWAYFSDWVRDLSAWLGLLRLRSRE